MPLLTYILTFSSNLSSIIIIQSTIFSLKKYLANKVNYIKTIIKAAIAQVKAYYQRNCVYYSVVIAYVIKYKVANTLSVYTKLF